MACKSGEDWDEFHSMGERACITQGWCRLVATAGYCEPIYYHVELYMSDALLLI